MNIPRRATKQIRVGRFCIGGDAPVSVQGMAKVSSADVPALLRQVRRMERRGVELVRIAVLNVEETGAIPALKAKFSLPVIADIHYDHRLALAAIERGADKIRINPGNMGRPGLREIIRAAGERGIPVRVGINSGSVPIRGSLVSSIIRETLAALRFFEDRGFTDLVVSLKTPSVRETIVGYRELAGRCEYPFHLGITEAGSGLLAEAKSVLGIGSLLLEGIGDTLRVSLTGPPEEEVSWGRAILQAAGLRRFEPEVISCPTCGRTHVDLPTVVARVKSRLAGLARRHPEIARLTVAVMGCPVNGPGEAKQADIGIAGGRKRFALFAAGRIEGTYSEAAVVDRLVEEIRKRYAKSRGPK